MIFNHVEEYAGCELARLICGHLLELFELRDTWALLCSLSWAVSWVVCLLEPLFAMRRASHAFLPIVSVEPYYDHR